MPHRRLVQIGGKPAAPPPESLPTVAQYFSELATRQGEDIRLLKERAQAFADLRASRKADAAHRKSVREESWRLHPVVKVSNTKKSSKRAAKKRTVASRTRTKKSARAKHH